MKNIFVILAMLFVSLSVNDAHAQWNSQSYSQSNRASIVFKNKSEYTMTLKIVGIYGGLYTTVSLYPQSSNRVYFGSTCTYKLKIKAECNGSVSYHDGGNFSVTCNEREYTEGEMSFSLSTYGSGLGPRIPAQEFYND